MKNKKIIYCVLVTFNPEPGRLRACCASIVGNEVELVLIDNGSSNIGDVRRVVSGLAGVVLHEMGRNIGIAAAQNHGMYLAIKSGAEFIWLSDQDTVYEHSYAEDMMKVISRVEEDFACIGPVYMDGNRGELQPLVKFSPFTKKFMPEPGINIVSHVIASGCIIPSKNIIKVGGMQENLFIDWVDMEWCWRALKKFNLRTLVNGDVVIDHVLGDKYKKIFGRKVVLRSPFRHYHMIRNAIFISLYSDSVFLNQRVELFVKAFVWSVLFPVLSDNRREDFLAACRGIFDGVLARMEG